jgi:hypothetical protein
MTLPRRVGKLLGEGLREEDRRPQIDLEVSLPTLRIEAFDRIPIEAGRVVDEASYGPSRRRRPRERRKPSISLGQPGALSRCRHHSI